MKESDLIAEVEEIVSRSDEAVPVSWISGAIMKRHPAIDGDDKDFYVLCAWKHLEVAVRSVVRRYKKAESEEPDQQIVLEGFERLQKKYHVERAGEPWLVPIGEMTAQEIREKAEEYRRMGAGCFTHARELDRYADGLSIAM